MGNNNKTEVIDLTKSFTLVEHSQLSNTVIDLDSDESFDSSVRFKSPRKPIVKVNKINAAISKLPSKKSVTLKKKLEKSPRSIGNCPICWDELGEKPLASTKCGHVYCLQCLERSLQQEKRCPSCRLVLKGKLAYHPLYLSKN